MSYSIRPAKRVERELRRVAREQLGKAIADIDEHDDVHEAVHEVRKRTKKARALARLLRPCFPSYSDVNAAARDAARRIADLRDAHVNVLTLEQVRSERRAVLSDGVMEPVQQHLRERRGEILRIHDSEEQRLALVRADLVALLGSVDHWTAEASGFDTIEGGLAKTYGRARDAMREAYATETAPARGQRRARRPALRALHGRRSSVRAGSSAQAARPPDSREAGRAWAAKTSPMVGGRRSAAA